MTRNATAVQVGDGDVCPVDHTHGYMLHLKSGSRRQYCPHIGHVPQRERDGMPAVPATPNLWPTGIDSFPAAVAKWKESSNG